MREATLHTDGGSRGNPGPAGCGFVLHGASDDVLCEGGWFLGSATNNVAEYEALVWGLRNAIELGVVDLHVRADSELMVKQMKGQYKVKNAALAALNSEATSLCSRFSSVDFQHVYRSDNKRADELANEAMDAQGSVGTFRVGLDQSAGSLFDVDDAPVEAQTATAADADDGGIIDRSVCSAPVTASFSEHRDGRGIYELTVKSHFDAAHALPGYDGPCRFLHGHTWDVEVTVAGDTLDDVGLLYDFKAIKNDLNGILKAFDHHLINDIAPFDTISPTAEHMARVIYGELDKKLPSSIALLNVAVWESPAAKVVYRPIANPCDRFLH